MCGVWHVYVNVHAIHSHERAKREYWMSYQSLFYSLRHGLSLNRKLTDLGILMASELQGRTCLHPQVHSHVWLLHGCWGSELGLSCLYSKHLCCRASPPLPNCVCVCKHYLKTRSQTFWVILHCGVFELLLLIRWSGLEEKQSKVHVCAWDERCLWHSTWVLNPSAALD